MQKTKKRRNKKSEHSPAMAVFDKVVVVMGILNVFATLPQVIAIWSSQSAAGVSSFSWGYYSVFSLTLLLYGFLHKEKPIIATYTGSVVLFVAIFIGSLVY